MQVRSRVSLVEAAPTRTPHLIRHFFDYVFQGCAGESPGGSPGEGPGESTGESTGESEPRRELRRAQEGPRDGVQETKMAPGPDLLQSLIRRRVTNHHLEPRRPRGQVRCSR